MHQELWKLLVIKMEKKLLSELNQNQMGICVGVKDSSTDFLKYLDKQKIALGSVITILDKDDYDDLMRVEINGIQSVISTKIAGNLFIKKQ